MDRGVDEVQGELVKRAVQNEASLFASSKESRRSQTRLSASR